MYDKSCVHWKLMKLTIIRKKTCWLHKFAENYSTDRIGKLKHCLLGWLKLCLRSQYYITRISFLRQVLTECFNFFSKSQFSPTLPRKKHFLRIFSKFAWNFREKSQTIFEKKWLHKNAFLRRFLIINRLLKSIFNYIFITSAINSKQ